MESTRYRFTEFELDGATFELLRSGERVHLERLPMELLFLLASRQGELVSREEIAAKLWGSEVFIDTNTAINVAVRKIRQVLDDNVESPRYILTVPAKGYRFIGPISANAATPGNGALAELDSVSGKTSNDPHPQPAPGVDDKEHGRTRSRWLILTVGIFILVFAVVAIVQRKHQAPAGKLMFVVLPFENLTGDPAQEYIADGMTEEMITQMGSLDPERIGVIARTSAMRFKGKQQSIQEIADELGVGYLLEGSVRHAGDRVRVTAQLIQASDQTHLWAADYDSNLSDLLKLESDIAGAIASQVQVKLDRAALRRTAHPVVPEAQAAYLRGLEDWNLRTSSSMADAVSEFERAVAADPNYALPYAALARCYAIGPIFGVGDPLETMPRARELSARALQLDPEVAEAHSILAMVAAHYDYDWPTAEHEFQTALRLNPSDPYAHLFYSNSFLSPHGRHQEAIDEMQKAIALDPFSIPLQAFLVRTYTWARRYDDARSQFERTNEVAPNFAVLHERAAHLFAGSGDFKQAVEEDAHARMLNGEQAEQVIAGRDLQLKAVAERGGQGYWQMQLKLSQEQPKPPEGYVTPFGLAVIYARLGNKELALTSLEQAFERRDVQLTEMDVEPAFDGLRADPRFQMLLRRIHLA